MGVLKVSLEYAKVYENFIRDFNESAHSRYSLYGGRNSGKSTAGYELAIDTVTSKGNVLVARRFKNSIRGSSYNNIVKLINKLNLSKYFKCTQNPMRIVCKLTGYEITFVGLDDPQKIKSSTASIGNYKLVIFEETQEIAKEEFCDEAISSFERGQGSNDFKVLYIFNPPPNKNHWCNTKLRKSIPGRLYALQVNYCDIPPEWVGKEIDTINRLKETNYNLYRYRYLGEPISVENLVFENVVRQEITDEQIAEWIKQDRYLFVGLDFGYSPDPNAAGMMYYDPINRDLYIFKEYYSHKKNNQQISEGLLEAGFTQDYMIIADNDQKAIDDLRSYGWLIRAAKKQKLRDTGFRWLQTRNRIIIDPVRCPEHSEEFGNYHYVVDRDGNQKSMYPEGQADHCIAEVRYALERLYIQAGV